MIKKHSLLNYLLPGLMLFFFARNLVLVETDHMDSWMGGGMRMFGKIDKMLYRVSGFNVDYNNKTYFVNLRNIPELEDEDVAARILPNDERINEILNTIGDNYRWCYDKASDKIYLGNEVAPCDVALNKDAITNFQVYSVTFQRDSKRVDLQLLNEANK
ncbi:hypothetical protein WIW50_09615 [Flavobacteriaceae bacterium 3-367]|uniref:hypothetical protein n=1 Tax=Eudoraea algarum TaxID=3417568 RepID=UPI003278CE0E